MPPGCQRQCPLEVGSMWETRRYERLQSAAPRGTLKKATGSDGRLLSSVSGAGDFQPIEHQAAVERSQHDGMIAARQRPAIEYGS